jgi:hypothetical protein
MFVQHKCPQVLQIPLIAIPMLVFEKQVKCYGDMYDYRGNTMKNYCIAEHY